MGQAKDEEVGDPAELISRLGLPRHQAMVLWSAAYRAGRRREREESRRQDPRASAQREETVAGGRLPAERAALHRAVVNQTPFPLAPEKHQTEIVRRIEAAFAWLDRVASEHANATRLLRRLDQAILAKAFREELVLSQAEASVR